MPNNWKKAVEKLSREKFKTPDGWDTKETVALQLGCSPDRVKEIIKPGLESGDFERREFMIWDERRGVPVRTMCYRIADRKAPAPAPEKLAAGATVEERILVCAAKHPDWTNLRIAKSFRGITVKDVERIRGAR